MHLTSAAALCGILLGASSLIAGDARAIHVFGSDGPDDQRLRHSHDVDHPVIFTPDLFENPEQWRHRAVDLREQVLVAEGLWPLPERTPLHPVIHGRIDRDDYTIEKVFFASYPGHYVSGNLYRPKNRTGKLPVVLCPHGHWPGGRFFERTDKEARQQIEEGAERTMEGAKYPLQARCAMLARMGCIVFHYDMVGYADSTAIEHRQGFTDAQALLRLQSFMGLQTWNSIRSLDFVRSLPDVDADRIAVTGASGGGTQTFILCAIDDRPAVAFPAVMVGEEMQGGCICENAPLLRVGTNNTELAATFAPKPLGMSAANDWTRAMETDAYPKIQTIYGLFGAKKNVLGRHFSFEHNYNQVSREMMYNWFNDHLKLGWPRPVKEKPFEPAPRKELSVYDEQHPRPSDSADAATLRKYMTESSDGQLDELWKKDPDEYRRTVRTALGVMIHDRLPEPGDVVVSRSSGPRVLDGVVIETGALSRRGNDEAVPYASLVPQDWNGQVVLWVSPAGKSSLFEDAGNPSANARRLLDHKIAVASADLFLTGEYAANGGPHRPEMGKYENQNYAGFYYGYNRGELANQVHDLLTLIGFVRHWTGTQSVDLLAAGKSGTAALLSRSLAGDAIRRSAIDLAGFDFDQIRDPQDHMMLPGAIKYGGVCGFIPLCDSGQTLITGMKKSATPGRAARTRTVTLRDESLGTAEMLDWLVQPR